MKHKLLAFAAPLALALSPSAALAQSEKDQMAQLASVMEGMFTAEPLTAEQESRLPQAETIIAKVVPDGTYARMMNDVIDQMVAPMAAMMPTSMPPRELAQALGIEEWQISELAPDQIAQLSSTIDPQFAQRVEAGMRYMMEEMVSIFTDMEPALRLGLARAYAVRFDEQQLADIAAFFDTPSGDAYARESFVVMADPQVMSASMEMLPAMMERMPQIIAGMEERMAQLPAPRKFAELSAQERADTAGILGLTVPELKTSMQAAN